MPLAWQIHVSTSTVQHGNSVTEYAGTLNTASGPVLDLIAQAYDLDRNDAETDTDFRDRLSRAFRGYLDRPFELTLSTEDLEPKKLEPRVRTIWERLKAA